MNLISFNFSSNAGRPYHWSINGLELGSINLLVGKNATGKTRTLTVLIALSDLIAGNRKLTGSLAVYDAILEHEGKEYHYHLETERKRVISETLKINGDLRMDRSRDGYGHIWSDKSAGMLEFQTPDSEIAVYAKRDLTQHEFLEPLYKWASSFHYFRFGSSLGKNAITVLASADSASEVEGEAVTDFRNKDMVTVVLQFALGQYGDTFIDRVKSDMRRLHYYIDDIFLIHPTGITLSPDESEAFAIGIKESGVEDVIEQKHISQGMFRALSVVIHLNFLELTDQASCIVIDDIGEGLDFERSCSMIDLLMDKAKQPGIQLIMATNDRFIMNAVPIENWSVLQRAGSSVKVYNYHNSKSVFDDFKFTGLSNFDFFAMDFVNEEALSHA